MKTLVSPAPIRVAPAIAAELRREIARLRAGPLRLPGTLGSDDPGYVSPHAPEPEFHPDAARLAEQMRAERQHPVDHETVADWLRVLSYGGAHFQPVGDAAWEAYTMAAGVICGDIPMAIWRQDGEALKDAMKTFDRWPSVARLHQLLKRHDDAHLADIKDLERMATAPPARGPAREAKGYNPPAYITPKEQQAEVEHEPALPTRTVEEQLAAVGLTPEMAAAALKATNERRGVK